jgi:hypothetical protein
MQPLQPAAQHIDIMLPHRFAEEILAVWQLPPLRLSPAECRSCSAMMLAAQTLRQSSRDWLRVLDLKHSESKAALLTVPYLRLPATVLGDIYKFIVCDDLDILEHLREAALRLSVPRSIAVVEGNTFTFRYRQTRDAVIEKVRLESVLHNKIRSWISSTTKRNLIHSSQIHILKHRAVGLMDM